ncbi:MAG: arginine--tRNA ligase [Deltaproteobacteria bacterium]|nr:arginine--tRNA ligase [Deltaproteobacteria bacterium]
MNAKGIEKLVAEAVENLRRRGALTTDTTPVVGRTKSEEHGDFTTNFAMIAAKLERKKPRDIAALLAAELSGHADIETAEVAGPGFVNLRVRGDAWVRGMDEALTAGESFGRLPPTGNAPINVEFVSANPTGPLHVGHGRGAVVGDALVRLLRAAGREVSAEYYWNDRGRQVRELGRSVWIRLHESLHGKLPPIEDENWYRGDYVKDLARDAASDARFAPETSASATSGPLAALAALGPDEPRFVEYGCDRMKASIIATLARLRVAFQHQTSERSIAATIEPFFSDLEARDLAYRDAGALFLRVEGREGEDKDRVVRKSDGEWTYFATDLLYHANKLDRGFGRLINIWGADHHGYIPRMHAGLAALGRDPKALEVLLVQMVNLTAGGQPVKMSKRSGDFVTLDELVDEVGVDATRYVFLTRRHDSQLDFDIELAKKKSLDNPVFYAQYGHARLCAILRRGAELLDTRRVPEPLRPLLAEGLGRTSGGAIIPPGALGLPEERKLARTLLALPDHVAEAAEALEPHRIVYFVQELSQAFQRYYTERWKRHADPVLPPARLDQPALAAWDWERTAARLRWIRAIRAAVRGALDIAGVQAPERMDRSDEGEREDEA